MIGAIIGDYFGSKYEFDNIRTKDFKLNGAGCFLTDDSIMTFAIAECIQNRCAHINDKVVDIFKKWGRRYPTAGYGNRFANCLFSDNDEPYGSYGNGAAMRISPVGWYARNEEEVKILSRKVTEVTHNHPEGLKGAEVVAMCVYYARIGKSKEFIKKYVENYYNLDFDYEDLRKNYRFNETCQESIPQAIYCFLISKDFEDCLRTTISIGGDCDTTAAISCAIAEAFYKEIPEEIYNLVPFYDNSKKGLARYNVLCKFLLHRCEVLVKDELISEETKFVCISLGNNKLEWIHCSKEEPLVNYVMYSLLDYLLYEDEQLGHQMLDELDFLSALSMLYDMTSDKNDYKTYKEIEEKFIIYKSSKEKDHIGFLNELNKIMKEKLNSSLIITDDKDEVRRLVIDDNQLLCLLNSFYMIKLD